MTAGAPAEGPSGPFLVAAVQFDIAWERKAENHRRVEAMLDEAEVPAGTFVLLPELGDTGFSFDLEAIVDDGRTLAWAQGLASRRGIWIQAGHAVRGDEGLGRNCATIVSPAGEILGTNQKIHPFSYGRETDHFRGGQRVLVRRCGDGVVAPMICYDLRFPELWRLATLAGAEIFTIGASWPRERQHHWRALLIARAIENQAYVVAVNRIGDDPNLSYVGGSIVVSPSGEILAEATNVPTVLTARLDLEALRRARAEFPALRDIQRGLVGSIEVDAPIER